MDRATAQAVAYMGEQVYAWMENNLSAYNVGFEFLPEESPAMMLQSQVEDPIVKQYKSGRTVYRYPFSIYLRMDNADNESRINNQRELQAAAEALLDADIPLVGFTMRKPEQDTTVSVLSTEQGMDVCYVTLHIDYERSSENG